LREDDERSWVLKACVLTEDGIAKGSKVNLLLARDIFEEVAEKSARWVDHYNYGNVLSALGDNEGAKQEYLAALRYDERQAEVWKNLGVAYFHLRDHQQELNCYDKALAINGRLTEAILSKGVTLLTVFGEAHKGAELIASAIEADDSLAIRWPHVWYWLARAYCELGNFVEALKEVDSGLAIVPHHLGLLNLKAVILSKLWKEDSQFIEKAISFFRFRVELSHKDYDSIAELVRLYSATRQEELVWSTLKSYIDLGGGEFLPYVRLTGLSLEDYLESFKYFPAYKNFRQSSLLSDYTGLLNEQQISPDDDLENAMLIVCAIPFGLACDILAKLPQEQRYEAIEQIQSTILNSLRSSLPRLATKLLNGVQVAEIDQFADRLSRLLLVWADIALVEFSRQLGFVSAIFGVTAEKLENATTGEVLGSWQMEVISDTLIEINKQLKVFKE
jgi:tetratricopeptide (TPR) repeat protein